MRENFPQSEATNELFAINIGGKMLQDEKKLERLIEIQEEITKLTKEMHRIQERIYFLARERDSL